MSGFLETTNTSTNDDSDAPKFGDGFDSDSRLTARRVAEETGKLFAYYDEKLKEYKPDIDKLVGQVAQQEKELKIARTDNSKSLAVFVAFFTFVSISFSILPRISEPFVLLGVLLALLGSLTFFLTLFAWILDIRTIDSNSFTTKQIVMGVLALALLVGGFFSAYFGYKDMENNDFYTQTEVDTLLSAQKTAGEEYTNTTFSKFKTCIAIHGGIWPCLSE